MCGKERLWTMIENKLSFAFSFSLAAGACVRLSFSNAERGTLAGLGGNVSVGRSAPQVASHSLTYCLVWKKWVVSS